MLPMHGPSQYPHETIFLFPMMRTGLSVCLSRDHTPTPRSDSVADFRPLSTATIAASAPPWVQPRLTELTLIVAVMKYMKGDASKEGRKSTFVASKWFLGSIIFVRCRTITSVPITLQCGLDTCTVGYIVDSLPFTNHRILHDKKGSNVGM
jgi:hypothetical protein